MEDIEKLKEAAFKLAESLKSLNGSVILSTEEKSAIATIESFKPKVEPLECWVNVYPGEQQVFHTIKASADFNLREGGRTVHLREVTPVEWERWEVVSCTTGAFFIHNERNLRVVNVSYSLLQAKSIADAHNAEMKRVTGTEGK